MDITMIIMRIVALSVFVYLLRWLFLFIIATVAAARRRLTTSGKILTLSVGVVFCWWLVVHLAYMADMAKQRLEWSVVLRRILSTLVPILFFKWLIRYFMLVATSSWHVVSDAESEESETQATTNKNPLVICFGEMLIDFVPLVAGESLRKTSGFVKAPGGAPANVAVAIARLGGNSAFIGKLGDDEFGRMLDEILEENGVNRRGVQFDKDARTALSFVTLKEDGEREFMFYRHPSADMLLRESELDFDFIRKATILHFGSVSLISEPCRGAHLAAIKAARAAATLLSYDPNVRLPLWPSPAVARQRIMSIWYQVDFIKVSCDEVEFLIEKDPYDDDVVMSNLWFDGLKLLLVTDGKKGCRYFTKDLRGRVEGFTLSQRVDSTGAGDAFVGALLFSLAKDVLLYQDEQKLREALLFASACGALTTTKKGAIPALPTPNMALDLLRNLSLQGLNYN